MLSKMALGLIWGYQQFVSPRKGFRCAYSVRYGGTGCSGYAKYAIRDHGLWSAIPAIRHRLADCKTAHLEMRAACPVHSDTLDESERAELERRRSEDKRRKKNRCTDGCCSAAVCECGSIPAGCGSGGARAAGSKGCDTNPCDGDIGIGGCDCASCDAGGCDCGGCSCS